MLKIIGRLFLLLAFSVGIGIYATGFIVGYALKEAPQRVQLRGLTDQEKWQVHLYERVLSVGLTYKDYRLLKRIAQAESHFQQYDENGSVLRGFINPKDTGIFQINEGFHLASAQKLGMNIYEPEGNIDYAVYIYAKDGSFHWNWSKSNWSK